MIVVDTNVIASMYLNSEHSHQAAQALLKDSHWIAPALWRSEMRNVLAHYLRKQILSLDIARQIMEEAISLMIGHEYDVVSHQVLDLVASSTCSAYDCEFVALARDLDILLITTDRQILKQFPGVAVSLENYIQG
jgi:predicted nucleic acid-binding protein